MILIYAITILKLLYDLFKDLFKLIFKTKN